ncbi:MAG: hypothetical protein EOO09_12230 [Chitinophagaceae bacterium]|nr:MAG: hypothetical protein EOO09_12230 [Chitinophagaceae bacterium]
MTLFNLMGLLSTLALALPIIFMGITRLGWYKCFPALMVYFLLLFSHNLTSLGFVPAAKEVISYQSLINKLLHAPLMLCFLTYFSQTAAYRKSILVILGVYLAFEAVVVLILGPSRNTNTVIMIPGLLIVLFLTTIFCIHYVKLTLVNPKALGKLLMIFSIFLAYGVYCFIYVYFFLIDTQFIQDSKLIYFLLTIISSIVLSIGLLVERSRVRHLEELHKTREELKALYGDGDTNTAIPFETAVFKFEKGKIY